MNKKKAKPKKKIIKQEKLNVNLDELTIGQVKQLQCLIGGHSAPQADSCCEDGKIVMAILQRGWVFVGRIYKEGSHFVLKNAVNYRYQGSGKGFGYTAKHGPTSNCKLDKCELPVRYHELTEVARMDCEESAWASKLA